MKEISRIMGIGKEMIKMATAVLSGFDPLVRVRTCMRTRVIRDRGMVSNVSSDRGKLITNSRKRRSLDIKIICFMETDASSSLAGGVYLRGCGSTSVDLCRINHEVLSRTTTKCMKKCSCIFGQPISREFISSSFLFFCSPKQYYGSSCLSL